jgi:hypothetical protein
MTVSAADLVQQLHDSVTTDEVARLASLKPSCVAVKLRVLPTPAPLIRAAHKHP